MPLTEEQRKVVEAAPDEKLLVTAGPGTGKTFVLIERLKELVGKYHLKPGREILVLSFSRAAIQEIRKRTSEVEGSAGYVKARTFDSFGTFLLSKYDPNGEWINQYFDYDGRIQCAIQLIEDNRDAKEYMECYEHVFVDEMQDLVGVRADFVMKVLEATDCGFTLLGDPAQGIYNFQLEVEQERRLGSAVLYNWVREQFKDDLKELPLNKNHRAETDIANRAASVAGEALNSQNPEYEDILSDLEDIVLELDEFQKPEQVIDWLDPIEGTTAILCRNNGQALMISRYLRAAEKHHLLKRRATDRLLPKWIGTVLCGLNERRLGKLRFKELISENPYCPAPDDAWRELKRMEDGPVRDTIDLNRLARNVHEGTIPDDLCAAPLDDSLVVSTVHRAKGLEFERVVLVYEMGKQFENKELELPEETRILYVALTRARREIYSLKLPDFKGFLWQSRKTERWTRRYGKWKFGNFEVRSEDVHYDDPAGGFILEDCDVTETQEYIRDDIEVGDDIELGIIDATQEDFPPYYAILHDEEYVGVMSRRFSMALYYTLKLYPRWEVRWPRKIESLHVEEVDTVAGMPGAGRVCGLGESDIWLRVRVAGFGRLIW